MSSTSESDLILNVDNVHVAFRLNMTPDQSLRGQFIQMMAHPMDTLLKQTEYFHVLRGINLQARKGDRIAIVGRNGAGKTTLCRCISGFYSPQAGSVHINGTIRSILDHRGLLYPDLTGRENANIVMKLLFGHLMNKEQLKTMTEDALNFSELGAFLDTPYRTYSSGMQTRLGLSIATSIHADLFILDEVYDGADKSFQNKISKRIHSLIEKSGCVLFVSHSEDQIRKVCNKAVYLKNGQIETMGSVDDVLQKYNDDIRISGESWASRD